MKYEEVKKVWMRFPLPSGQSGGGNDWKMAEHIAELEARLASLEAVAAAVSHKVETWNALCKCVDEFGDDQPYCSEYVDADDTAMLKLKAMYDALAPGGGGDNK